MGGNGISDEILVAFHRHSANSDLAMQSIAALGISPTQVREAISELVDEDKLSFVEAGWLKRAVASYSTSDARLNPPPEDYHTRLMRENPRVKDVVDYLEMEENPTPPDEAAVAFWEGRDYSSGQSSGQGSWGSGGGTGIRDEVEVTGEGTRYLLWGNEIARLIKHQGRWEFHISNAGWTSPLTHNRLNSVLRCMKYYFGDEANLWGQVYQHKHKSVISVRAQKQKSIVKGESASQLWTEKELPPTILHSIIDNFYLNLMPIDFDAIIREAREAATAFLGGKSLVNDHFFVDHGGKYEGRFLRAGYKLAFDKEESHDYSYVPVSRIRKQESKLEFMHQHWGFPVSQVSYLGNAVLQAGKGKYPVLNDYEIQKQSVGFVLKNKARRGSVQLKMNPTIDLKALSELKPKKEKRVTELMVVEDRLDVLQREFEDYRITHEGSPKDYVKIAELVGKEDEYLKLRSRLDELEWKRRGRGRLNPQVPLTSAKGIRVLCPVTECFTNQCDTCLLLGGIRAKAVDCRARRGAKYHLLFDEPMPMSIHNDWNTRVVDPDNPPSPESRMMVVVSKGGD
jgi:hypothetical protein